MSADDSRLTDLDYARIDDRVSARCADLVAYDRCNYSGRYRPTSDVLTFTRLAHHAIGCSAADLRDCELDAIDCQVGAVLAFYDRVAASGGAFYRVTS